MVSLLYRISFQRNMMATTGGVLKPAAGALLAVNCPHIFEGQICITCVISALWENICPFFFILTGQQLRAVFHWTVIWGEFYHRRKFFTGSTLYTGLFLSGPEGTLGYIGFGFERGVNNKQTDIYVFFLWRGGFMQSIYNSEVNIIY